MNNQSEGVQSRRFLWGVLLAWVPLFVLIAPTVVGALIAFRAVATQRATGLGAVAGGFTESFVIFGVIAFVACEVGAIMLLARSFSHGHPFRAVIAVLSIAGGVLALSFTGLLFWVLTHISR